MNDLDCAFVEDDKLPLDVLRRNIPANATEPHSLSFVKNRMLTRWP